MEEPFTDGDDYARHRQLVLVDAVTPISHSVSSTSSISPNDGAGLQKVPGSDGVHSNTVSPTNMLSIPKFTLPKDWSVKKVPRKFGGLTDKYYRDPETGRQFRSLKEVERFITEGITPPKTRLKRLNYLHDVKVETHTNEGVTPTKTRGKRVIYHHDEKVEKHASEGVTPTKMRVKGVNYHHDEKVEKHTNEGVTPTKTRVKRVTYHQDEKDSGSKDMILADGKMLDWEEDKTNQYQFATVGAINGSTPSPFKLPDGWVVEEVPRRSGGYADKYYYEPGTGQKFRSLLAVQKHLSQVEENSPLSVVLEEIRENNLPLSKAFKLSSPIKDCGSYNSWKQSIISRKEKTCPPSKVNWVIAGCGGDDAWNAFVDQTLVPESVKQQWGNTFMMAINNTKHNSPVSG